MNIFNPINKTFESSFTEVNLIKYINRLYIISLHHYYYEFYIKLNSNKNSIVEMNFFY